MARRHTEVFLDVIEGEGFAEPNPRPMFPNPPGLLRVEPHSEGLRQRIWWGAASNATARWAAEKGMHLMSSTLKSDESGEPFHVQQREQIEVFREAWAAAGHEGSRGVSVSRSIMPITTDLDRTYFGREGTSRTSSATSTPTSRGLRQDVRRRADVLVKELADDEAIAAADTLLLTVPNQLGVDYNAHLLESILPTSRPSSAGAEAPEPQQSADRHTAPTGRGPETGRAPREGATVNAGHLRTRAGCQDRPAPLPGPGERSCSLAIAGPQIRAALNHPKARARPASGQTVRRAGRDRVRVHKWNHKTKPPVLPTPFE